ncbi:hypothetical protein NPIL_425761 [Nephila pilipes]|uniref:Uncharacterized protein n=1 Tax=Nephila pilipes TaxID=299642 RepID=A0A8X6Q958_NEPPI|nr:hypothetical protein NPIL_425761 [Nephila pilipes]
MNGVSRQSYCFVMLFCKETSELEEMLRHPSSEPVVVSARLGRSLDKSLGADERMNRYLNNSPVPSADFSDSQSIVRSDVHW